MFPASIIVDVKRARGVAGDSPACVQFHDPCVKLDSMFRRIFPAILVVLLFVLVLAHPIAVRAATKPNIVLITIASTRADRMGFLGSKAKITPNLDGLALQSMVFERAFSQTPLNVVSHASILSGTYPQTHHVTEFGARLAPNLPFVPDLLQARGYRTAAFVGSIALDPKNGLAPGFDRGFTLYDAGFQPPVRGKSGSVARPAAQVVSRASAWLARDAKQTFFLWMHLDDPEAASADVALLGFDISLTYARLWKLCNLVRAGAPYIATHPDINCPTEGGYMPDTGAMIALVAASTGRQPDVIIGKPYRAMVAALEEKLGLPAEQIAMVGDRLYTDIALGKAGIKTVLVLSGETRLADLQDSPYQPDVIVQNLAGLVELLTA